MPHVHTRLYAGSPLKQDSIERVQALGLEGKTGRMEWNGQNGTPFFCLFLTSKTERNGTSYHNQTGPFHRANVTDSQLHK